jgi:hypothetical protein
LFLGLVAINSKDVAKGIDQLSNLSRGRYFERSAVHCATELEKVSPVLLKVVGAQIRDGGRALGIAPVVIGMKANFKVANFNEGVLAFVPGDRVHGLSPPSGGDPRLAHKIHDGFNHVDVPTM